jgi:putative PIN family toxin of toxin-antitoxin system
MGARREVTLFRAVLDTNIVVSALVFPGGHLSWLRAAWLSGKVRPLISRPAASELIRVLHYPKFRLEPDEREFLLGEYLPFCEVVPVSRKAHDLPQCRDPGDLMFLRLAADGKADFLVTGDADLLSIKQALPYRIVTADSLRMRFDPALGERAPRQYAPVVVVKKRLSREPTKARARAVR